MRQEMIDVREYPEFAAGHIEGSRLVPLRTIGSASAGWDRTAPLLLVCKSGRRAQCAYQELAEKGFTSISVLEGGIDGWRAAGEPLVLSRFIPWSMERQVRVAAGSLVLSTVALACVVSPFFLLGTGLVGAGLVFAGMSDICMMGSVLARLPWNRPA